MLKQQEGSSRRQNGLATHPIFTSLTDYQSDSSATLTCGVRFRNCSKHYFSLIPPHSPPHPAHYSSHHYSLALTPPPIDQDSNTSDSHPPSSTYTSYRAST